MIIVDAHQDIAYLYQKFGRDYRISALKHRQNEAGKDFPDATVGLPESLVGRVAVIFSTLFVAPAAADTWKATGGERAYKSAQEAHDIAMQQLDYYHRLADASEKIRLIQTAADLDAVLATWGEEKSVKERQQGFVVLMEGADPILEPKQFEAWYERGVRVVGPAWSTTRYCAGNGKEGGLTKLGYELLENIAGLNAILDVSHMSERALRETLDHYEGNIIASHSNARRFCDSDRHLPDELIKQLAERGAVIGTVLFNRFLSDDWKKGDPKSDITIATVVDAIDHVCQLAGSAAHAAIGTDFDGGFGAESIPQEFDTVADLILIASALEQRGYSEADIEAIMSGNMLRKLRQSLP